MITLDAFNFHIDEYNKKILLPLVLSECTMEELREDGYIEAELFEAVNEDDVFDDMLYHSVLDFRDVLPKNKLEYWDAEAIYNSGTIDDLAATARHATRDAMRDYMNDRFVTEIIKNDAFPLQPKQVEVEITVTTNAVIILEDGETVNDVVNRHADIYLHGYGDHGSCHKEDLGGDTNIKIIS